MTGSPVEVALFANPIFWVKSHTKRNNHWEPMHDHCTETSRDFGTPPLTHIKFPLEID